MEVEFATGTQLNSATHSITYSAYRIYALIWYGKGQVAIAQYEGFYPSIHSFTATDFEVLYYWEEAQVFRQVNDAYGRLWRIRAKDFHRFFDARVR